MKHLLIPMMLSVSLVITSTGLALAANVHAVTEMKGQPDQTIGTAQTGSVTPGHASTAPGSAFNPNGMRTPVTRAPSAELQEFEERVSVRRGRLPAIP